MKTLLFAIGCTTLLLTSCQKEEMGIGSTTGGGMQDDNIITKSSTNPAPKENEITLVADTTLKIDE